jgi:putative nucleotidyltransferase with HDIG domain
MTVKGRVYVWAVTLAGSLAVGHAVRDMVAHPPGRQWLLVALLTLISGSANIKLPGVPAHISVSESFLFSAVLLFGPSAGVVIAVIDALIIIVKITRRGSPLEQILFNLTAPALSLWLAANLFYLAAGVPPLVHHPSHISVLVLPLLLFTIVYFCLNSGLVACAVAFQSRQPAFAVWREHFVWLSLNFFGGASLAALLVVSTTTLDWTYLAVTVPLLLIFYMMFRTSMARVVDAHRHVDELNSLYLATVQTLAAAIDAKDKVTHSHIRRVQHYAVELAKGLGVREEMQLKAIQAAAVLHDTGKLAVPESILNKPGPLTVDEFSVMKRHASVGADIISSINFPYPVEPIVRHHHENWDGTGYPSGLVGTEIPLGARILAVVDCFDALTSDRPYRARMTDADALAIINERRGNMYDPLVVDIFLRIYPELRTSHGEAAAQGTVDQGAADDPNTPALDGDESPAPGVRRTGATEIAKY